MKVLINQQVSIDQIRETVTAQFPNYQVFMRNSNMMIVKKSGTAAAIVMVRKGKIIVNEAFPSMGGQLLFTLCMLLLGILIPLIVYLVAFLPAQKAVTKEVSAFLTMQYGAK